MTIKEVEQLLEVPRATVRFYEKEGLINPTREGNGYRDYSEKDVERLKQIIIFRKIGLSIDDIEDVFDGSQSVETVLETNLINLQKQIDELTGAMNLCNKMKIDAVQLDSFDTAMYWNYVEEEERKGNRFADIAKDIVDVEKKVILSYLGWTDSNGKLYDSPARLFINTIVTLFLAGCVFCLMRGSWSIGNFKDAIIGVGSIILLELVISIPMYFLEKRFKWIKNNRTKVLFIAGLVLVVLLLAIDFICKLI